MKRIAVRILIVAALFTTAAFAQSDTSIQITAGVRPWSSILSLGHLAQYAIPGDVLIVIVNSTKPASELNQYVVETTYSIDGVSYYHRDIVDRAPYGTMRAYPVPKAKLDGLRVSAKGRLAVDVDSAIFE